MMLKVSRPAPCSVPNSASLKICPEAAPTPPVDEETLVQLISMGFPEYHCRKALIETGNNGAEVATAWLFENPDAGGASRPYHELRATADGEWPRCSFRRAHGGCCERRCRCEPDCDGLH